MTILILTNQQCSSFLLWTNLPDPTEIKCDFQRKIVIQILQVKLLMAPEHSWNSHTLITIWYLQNQGEKANFCIFVRSDRIVYRLKINCQDYRTTAFNRWFPQLERDITVNVVFRNKEFGSFCQIWQIWIVIFWSCADVKGNDKNQ